MSEAGWNTPRCQGKRNIWQAKLFISNVIPTRGRRKSNLGGRYNPRFGCDFLGWVLSERWGKWYLEWARLLASKTLISLTGLWVNNATHESTPELYTHAAHLPTHTRTHTLQAWIPKSHTEEIGQIYPRQEMRKETKKQVDSSCPAFPAHLKLILLVFGALVERAVITETPDVVDFVEALDVVRNAVPLEDILAVWDWSNCVDLQVWVGIVSRSVTEMHSGVRIMIITQEMLLSIQNTKYEQQPCKKSGRHRCTY